VLPGSEGPHHDPVDKIRTDLRMEFVGSAMPWKYTEEYYREYTRSTWNESAKDYTSLMRRFEPVRSHLVAGLDPKAGERILDLGTGPGEPAMTIGRRVGPTGHVTGVDLSEKMIDLATQAAREQKIQNVEFRTMDCASLDLPSASFDGTLSCFGFQIFTDPETAAKEARRVLKPDGRIAVSVWGTGDKTPFLHAIIGPMLEHAEPDENGYIPTPYETGGPGEMVTFLEAAGFHDAREERRTFTMAFRDPDEYLETILKGTPIGHSLSEESPEVQAEVLAKTRENLRRWSTPNGVTLPAEVVFVRARV
jgi:ubiquinone/menaquinone biosynthesis C-methylase UbiE